MAIADGKFYTLSQDRSGVIEFGYITYDLLRERTPSLVPDVFLSYNGKDKEIADLMAKVLAQEGVNVYIDRNDPNVSGDSTELADYLRSIIQDSKSFLVLWTENAQIYSDWVPFEVGVAYSNSRKPLVRAIHGNPRIPSFLLAKRWNQWWLSGNVRPLITLLASP